MKTKEYKIELDFINKLEEFVELIIRKMIFDGGLLTDLLAPLGLGWKQRRVKELALMEDLIPLLKKLRHIRLRGL